MSIRMPYYSSEALLSFPALWLGASLDGVLAFLSKFLRGLSWYGARKGLEELVGGFELSKALISGCYKVCPGSFLDLISFIRSKNCFWVRGFDSFIRFSSSFSLMGNGDRQEGVKKGSYLLSADCIRIASFTSRSPSSFEIGFAILLSDFHTFSLSSWVLAWAKGLRFFALWSILQIYSISLTRHNRNVLFRPHWLLSPGGFCVLDFQYSKQSAGFFFWNYNHKQWYSSLSKDSLAVGITCAWGYPEQMIFQTGLSHPDSHLFCGSNLKNLCPLFSCFYNNEKPEENQFPREIQDGAIKLSQKNKTLFFNTFKWTSSQR